MSENTEKPKCPMPLAEQGLSPAGLEETKRALCEYCDYTNFEREFNRMQSAEKEKQKRKE